LKDKVREHISKPPSSIEALGLGARNAILARRIKGGEENGSVRRGVGVGVKVLLT